MCALLKFYSCTRSLKIKMQIIFKPKIYPKIRLLLKNLRNNFPLYCSVFTDVLFVQLALYAKFLIAYWWRCCLYIYTHSLTICLFLKKLTLLVKRSFLTSLHILLLLIIGTFTGWMRSLQISLVHFNSQCFICQIEILHFDQRVSMLNFFSCPFCWMWKPFNENFEFSFFSGDKCWKFFISSFLMF